MISVPDDGIRRKNAYGIEEPFSDEDRLCEVALVPLLAVDREGFRLGYGGGFYDRYFAAHPQILRAGLCYEGQIGKFPHDERDVPLDLILTERGIRYFENNAR